MQLKKILPGLAGEIRKLGGEAMFNSFVRGTLQLKNFEKALSNLAKNKAPDTMEESLTKMHHALQVFAYDIGTAALSQTDAQGRAEGLVASLAALEEKFTIFSKANPQIIKMAVGFAAVLAVIGPLAILIGMIANPISLITLAVLAAGVGMVYLYNKSQYFRDVVHETYNWFAQMYNTMMSIVHLFDPLYQGAKKFITQTIPTLVAPGGAMGEGGYKPAYSLSNMGTDALTSKQKMLNDNNIKMLIKVDQDGKIKDITAQSANVKTNLPLGSYMTSSR
jgi:uncharacterized membrane protein YphA (DoxX/SURF4 family)